MADAQTVIRDLGQQVAQLTADKAILQADLAEARERIADFEATYCTGEAMGLEANVEDDPPLGGCHGGHLRCH